MQKSWALPPARPCIQWSPWTVEECHNEWEITFEEIHRNGAIAYAIHDYINGIQEIRIT
jgi:hypothetical protein